MIHLHKHSINKHKSIGTINPNELSSSFSSSAGEIMIRFCRSETRPAGDYSIVGTEDEIAAFAQDLLRRANDAKRKRNEWNAHNIQMQENTERDKRNHEIARTAALVVWNEDKRRLDVEHENTMYRA